MLSLAYRVATMTPIVNQEFSELGTISRFWVPKAIYIRADNVNEFASTQGPQINLSDDIPNWTPPFKACFIEFQTQAVDETGNDSVCQAGAVILGHHDDTRRSVVGIMWGAFFGRHPLAGRPLSLGIFNVGLDETGKATDAFFNGADTTISDLNNRIMCVAGLTFSFMHCKNVIQVKSKDNTASNVFREQYKIPKLTYRTLCIDPMKEVLRREGASDTIGLKRALHICRGHFSTYSNEKPLFGKYPGTFWIPDHVRGKKEHGEIRKDYNVKPITQCKPSSAP